MRATAWNCLVVVLFVLSMAACSRTPPEQRLREQLTQMQQAVEQRRPGEVMESVADDFVGSHGLDRQGLERLLRLQLLRNARITVVLGPATVEMEQAHARMRFTALLAGGAGGRLPERGRMQQVDTHWRLVDDQWLLYSAHWEDGDSP